MTAKSVKLATQHTAGSESNYNKEQQDGLAVASIARDVVVRMTPPRNHNARWSWIGIWNLN